MSKVDLELLRREYLHEGLSRQDLNPDPFEQFNIWLQQATSADLTDATAMSLATSTKSGSPSLRTVLLKFFDQRGFVFYTNQESQKAREIAENPQVALLFYWREFERQVIIQGTATKVSTSNSLKYFLTRPRESQIGAWVSQQSEVISSRQVLEQKFDEIKRKFANKEMALPSFWGGYRIAPLSIEFWQGRENRLHDRFRYTKTDNNDWQIDRLSP
ncbi:MAG: pyridoxamine 5'-phosphate oxidase [Chromatiales bacterium]|nr:pyridoxamine 5'-phosphate oxidase [Chromatiales bacterium]